MAPSPPSADDPHPGAGAPAVHRGVRHQGASVQLDGLVDGQEHLAFGLGDRAAPVTSAPRVPVPLVRPHSECLTGDVFGSERCDCGPQLREATERIANPGGFLLYLPNARYLATKARRGAHTLDLPL
jgi:GTP cyclohydrolase II